MYRRGSFADARIFRQESYDYGMTWRADPGPGLSYLAGSFGVSHAIEVWNGRTNERVLLYNDQSEHDAQGVLTGRGLIKAVVFGPDLDTSGHLRLVGTFTVSTTLADDCSFGAIWIAEQSAIDCVLQVSGARNVYRSVDDARSWKLVS